jgi:hypothetical protein
MARVKRGLARLRQTVDELVVRCTNPAAAQHAAIAAVALEQLAGDTAATPAAALLRRVSAEIDRASDLQDASDREARRAEADRIFAAEQRALEAAGAVI